MKFRVGACALLVCLAGCTAEAPDTKFGNQKGAASASARTAQRLPSVQAGRQASQSVANAPDRGELISYKNKGAAIKREGAYTWYPVAISEAHALKAVVDGVMSIPSPDGSQVKVRYERHVEHPDGNWTWIGRVIGGDQKQEAILTFGEKAVFGSIPQKTGAPLSLQTRGGMLYAVQTDLSKVKNPNSRTDMMVPSAAAFHSTLMASASKAQVSQSAAETKAASAATTVDIALGYSAGLRAVYGSQSATVTRLVNLVDVGNQAYTNSLINGALRIVSAVEVNYADNTTNKAALSELTGYNGTTTVPVPTSLAPIRTARDQYGADLAVLVRKFQTPENDGCGIAWLNGSGQQPINPATDDDFGFAVISDGNDSDGTNSYFCADETLVHELGHLMGSAHDRDNSKKDDGSLLYGRYPYSFGMKTTEANGNFYTIMAYGDNNQNFYRTFSNPLVLKCGPAANLACGVTDQTDNARSLNQTIPVVAGFRATVVPFASGPVADANGDGRSDIFWHNQSGQLLDYWVMNGAQWTGGGARSVANIYRVGGIGDFDGNGRSDILWYDAAKTQLYVWLGNVNGGFDIAFVRSYPAGWDIAGIGDANADGRSDIFWHNPSAQALEYWLMNGAAWAGGGPRTVASIYRVAAINDFNGDGRADILWYDLAKTQLYLWQGSTTGAFTTTFVRSYPAGWNVVGAGDVNGDDKADVFWHNPTVGSLEYWLMNGAVWTGTGPRAVANVYTVAAVGDYNGDGRTDLIWRDNARTQLWQWQAQASGGFTTLPIVYPGGYPTGWEIVK